MAIVIPYFFTGFAEHKDVYQTRKFNMLYDECVGTLKFVQANLLEH